MNFDITLPPSLEAAARRLEQRVESSGLAAGLKACRIDLQDWNKIPPHLLSLIPPWIPVLLSRYTICHLPLEIENFKKDAGYDLIFGLGGPEYLGCLKSDEGLYTELYYRDLIDYGWITFSDAEGNEWVIDRKGGPESEVYFFEQTCYDGDPPSEKTCLTYAHKNVAALLDAVSYKADRYSRGFAAHDKTGLWIRDGK